ncbi:MAG TPA: acyl-CoA dehydrogenase [Caulobacteraceae bacterium]|jgi:acyl-CoA dehydrogenase|nr:acyl-CoA dehydrogenase [Caulobacteraceae bacterium]
MALSALRRDVLTRPVFRWARRALPHMSPTEAEAIAAGDVWWDAELFTGDPDWRGFLAIPPARLSDEEQAFLDGPVRELCAMLDDWKITWEDGDLPPQAWDFIKARRFFGMILPKAYGGLGFGPFAHSEVVRTLASRSATAAVTVMVPNSLGPGELLLRFGTEAQKDHWLPRLADGREIPAFGLTSPQAGSDAAAMTDTGVVCLGEHEGRKVIGLRLNWHKRYITLGPVATVLGLAFKLSDPERLLSDEVERGITVALVPTDTPGVEIGRRHLPAMQAFQNGPNFGRDVFLPLDAVIGGEAQVGKGWAMLNAALAAGRGISLPSQSAAGAALAARAAGDYARVRQQFGIAIGRFEGVGERLARLAANAYLLDAARRFTCAGLALGHHPSVISAIMKQGATERMRVSAADAMDVFAGKAIIDGPQNIIGNLYRTVPIGITVEGANILTRSLILFGQGAVRAHPYLLREMQALQDRDAKKGLAEFDAVFWTHAAHTVRTAMRSFARAWTDGALAPSPPAGVVRHHYRMIGRYAAAFALASDVALLTMGGTLKRKEMLSARFGDILSELYMLSAALKRWDEDGRQLDDLPLVDWIMADGFLTIETRLKQILDNFPDPVAAWLLRLFVLPFGVVRRGPSDAVTARCALILLEPSGARDRLAGRLYLGSGEDAIARLERAFELVVETQADHDRLRKLGVDDWAQARGLLSDDRIERLQQADAAVAAVIAVDDFAPEALSPRNLRTRGRKTPQPEPAQ